MNPAETATILRQFNEWRRLAQAVQAVPDSPRNIHERVNALHDLHDALLSGVVLEILDRLEAAGKERDELRARIAEMEQQEPAMWANSSDIVSARINQERGTVGDQHTCAETKTAYHDAPLYALPGAKGD